MTTYCMNPGCGCSGVSDPDYVCPDADQDTVLERCIARRQDALDRDDDDDRQEVDRAVLVLLTDDEYTAFTMAARAQDGDNRRRPWDNAEAFNFPYYCKECRAFTGNERHDHAQEGAQD